MLISPDRIIIILERQLNLQNDYGKKKFFSNLKIHNAGKAAEIKKKINFFFLKSEILQKICHIC